MAYIGFEVAPFTSLSWSAFPGALLHVTLAHFNTPTWRQAKTLAHRLVEITRGRSAPRLRAGDVRLWPEVGPVLLVEHSAELMEWRRIVLDELVKLHISVSKDYEYQPHMTLGEVQAREAQPPGIKVLGLELCGCPVIARAAFPLFS